jgi:hypothetical protein
VVVFYDGETYWLADGFHRVSAASRAGLTDIPAEVREGGQRDALLHACGANLTHGVRLTILDKRYAVRILLDDTEWSQWSDREIARQCGVSHPFVAKLREGGGNVTTPQRTVIRHRAATTEPGIVTIELKEMRLLRPLGRILGFLRQAKRNRATEFHLGLTPEGVFLRAGQDELCVTCPGLVEIARTMVTEASTR